MPSQYIALSFGIVLLSLLFSLMMYDLGYTAGRGAGKSHVYKTLYDKKLTCSLGTSFQPMDIE